MSNKKQYLVDVPVRINIWVRPECQRRQFEVLKQARPSIIFLQSDGGRNSKEWEIIKEHRRMFDLEIDWECKVHKIYEEKNLGMYAMGTKVEKYIWEHVDRCIFLEDDYIPAISYFRFCAELLEKYKDDKRIGMISGNNVFTEYPDAGQYDYFFSETGWSIWGTATWKDRMENQVFPLPYHNNVYIKNCLKNSLSAFWYNKVKGYCNGSLVDGHLPGSEYYYAVNSVLYHRLSIIPTKNMINNIGIQGAHAHVSKHKGDAQFFNLPTFEIEFPMHHPEYVIDDKKFGLMYAKKLGHSQTEVDLFFKRAQQAVRLLFNGTLLTHLQRKRSNKQTES